MRGLLKNGFEIQGHKCDLISHNNCNILCDYFNVTVLQLELIQSQL